MSDRLLSVNELVEKLNISRSTVLNWVREGKITSIKLGRQWRFRSQDIENWLKVQEKHKKNRFSLEGMIEDGQVDEKALDEVTKIWESRELQ